MTLDRRTYTIFKRPKDDLRVEQTRCVVSILSRIGHQRLHLWRQHGGGQDAGVPGNRAAKTLDNFKRTCLFRERPQTLEQYQERFLHVLVDEYQDTTPLQARLLELWLGERRDICVVGDEEPESGVRVRWRVDDLNTHSEELDRYYGLGVLVVVFLALTIAVAGRRGVRALLGMAASIAATTSSPVKILPCTL